MIVNFVLACTHTLVNVQNNDPARIVCVWKRAKSLLGTRTPTVLFFHPVPRGARARDYQTAGVRDCCTRQMLAQPSLPSFSRTSPSFLDPLPLETSHPVHHRSLFFFMMPLPKCRTTVPARIQIFPVASCHIHGFIGWRDGTQVYTVVVHGFFLFLVFSNVYYGEGWAWDKDGQDGRVFGGKKNHTWMLR